MIEALDLESTLTIFAEIGVAFAGFAGVVFALISSQSKHDIPLPNLSSLVTIAGAIVVAAFLPLILHAAEFDSDLVWVLASTIMFVWSLGIFLYRAKITPAVWTGLSRIVGVGLNVSVWILCLINIFLVKGGWPYVTMLVVYVLIALNVFYTFLDTLWRARVDER